MGIEITEIKKIWFDKINKNNKLFNKNNLVKELCKDNIVLDVGCVGQDIDYNSPKWIHNQIKNVSKEIVGVDINLEGIRLLKSKGYKVFHYNELNFEKKFDLILMLDVIEHINDPIKFINEYKKFLNDNGKIIITTPNSNRAINFINIFFKNDYSLNYEHTFWFCPKTFLEVLNRIEDININNFYWLNHYTYDYKQLTWKGKIIYLLDSFLIKLRSNFSPNFMFILEVKK